MPNLLDSLDFNAVGGAISDLFGSAGKAAEASAYGKAAGFATLDANITKQSTAIQEYQVQRQQTQSYGRQQSSAAANGLTGGGSAADILSSSHSQGALTNQLIAQQGLINESSFEAQAASYQGMQTASKAASSGNLLGGLLDVGKAAISIGSFLGF